MDLKVFVEDIKRKTNYGPNKMKLFLKKEKNIDVSTTTIYKFYLKRNLIRKSQKKLKWYRPLKEKLSIKNKGDGVQMDVKFIWKNNNWNYLFSVFDPLTRMYHFTIFKTKESKNAIIAIQNANNYFGFNINSIQTDNGGEFRGEFHDYSLLERLCREGSQNNR